MISYVVELFVKTNMRDTSGWISPDGEFIGVESYGHRIYCTDTGTTEDALFTAGWIACSFDFANHYINYHGDDITDKAVATTKAWYETNRVSKFQHDETYEELLRTHTQNKKERKRPKMNNKFKALLDVITSEYPKVTLSITAVLYAVFCTILVTFALGFDDMVTVSDILDFGVLATLLVWTLNIITDCVFVAIPLGIVVVTYMSFECEIRDFVHELATIKDIPKKIRKRMKENESK